MKKLLTLLFAAAAIAAAATACYDDSTLQSEINDLKDRVGKLEDQMKTANANIGNLTALVEALGKKLTVTSIENNSGAYTINFSDGTPITIQNGISPQIGVKQDTDGIYYWTVNGDWLLDDKGNKLRVTGNDGAPAIAPKLTINEGYWYISTDGGVTWEKLDKATGADGDSFFKKIDWDAAYLYITMADGTSLTLSRGTYGIRQLAVVPDCSDGSVMIVGASTTIRFDVRPASAAETLCDLPKDNYSLNVAYTMTKAAPGDELNLPVTDVMIEDGRITVTADASALDEPFRKRTIGASANLTVTYDQFNQVMSGYFPLFYDECNGYKFVDMGLSVRWATCNLGAATPEENGDYFAWGETEPKDVYNWSTYKLANGDYNLLTKYCPKDKTAYWGGEGEPDGLITLEVEDDAARAILGGGWRTPTRSEWKELVEECTWVYTDNYMGTGTYGIVAVSNKPGYTDRSVFFPAAGYRYKQDWVGGENLYWAASANKTSPNAAAVAGFKTKGMYYNTNCGRNYGLPIRPVIEYDPHDPGTQAKPYTPAQAAYAVRNLTWTSNTEYESTGDVYVKGIISSIISNGTFTEGGTYGNASFNISQDGTTDEFYCFRILYLGNKKFQSSQTDIKIGDEVVICGKLMNYRGTLPETVAGKAYLYSLNGQTE